MKTKIYCPLGCPKESVVGYCHYHKATLSEYQLKKKRCLEKQCTRLQRVPHPFWERREETKRLCKREPMVHMANELDEKETPYFAIAHRCLLSILFGRTPEMVIRKFNRWARSEARKIEREKRG